MLTDFHRFCINGEKRPYPILWYQTIILWACQFQIHSGNPPLGRRVTKKKVRKKRVKVRLALGIGQHCLCEFLGRIPGGWD